MDGLRFSVSRTLMSNAGIGGLSSPRFHLIMERSYLDRLEHRAKEVGSTPACASQNCFLIKQHIYMYVDT